MASFFAELWRLRFSIIVGIVAFIAFFFVGGTSYASGVLFNELLKKPCDDAYDASTVTGWNSTKSFACTLNKTVEHESCNHTSAAPIGTNCGGFGQSRGNTGIYVLRRRARFYSICFAFAACSRTQKNFTTKARSLCIVRLRGPLHSFLVYAPA